ncbi:unnamed protein product [Cyclocybe aegerita]|uniref:WD40 repeat-like protein n=1 Tax=Cyclocybe aegerita TaxID=1973307 RepID=A0A8S0WPM5_CYCAE|nr:unnamed protein product [Cyclocybe aegerita]
MFMLIYEAPKYTLPPLLPFLDFPLVTYSEIRASYRNCCIYDSTPDRLNPESRLNSLSPTQMENQGTWMPPPYNLLTPPVKLSTAHVAKDPSVSSNFARLAKWSPDGSVFLAQCENRAFELFGMSLNTKENQITQSMSTLPQASSILDFRWYPTASAHDPSSFCFVASVRECPVKLLDASDGRLRASYKIVDHRERQIAPHSLAFDLTAQKLYCGFEDAIEIFDLSRPGEGTRMHTTPSNKSKDGLKGIISALAFSPSYSTDESFYAAGSFTPSTNNIAMFSDQQETPLMFLQFNPTKPHLLYAAYRGSGTGSIYSWDVRSNVDAPLEILQTPASTNANSKSNQKFRFDVDIAGRMLGVGDQLGNVSIFDLESTNSEVDSNMRDIGMDDAPLVRQPTLVYKAHDDAVGSVAFHPYMPAILTTSGSRHFTNEYDKEEDSSESSEEEDGDASRPSDRRECTVRRPNPSHPVTFDSSIK